MKRLLKFALSFGSAMIVLFGGLVAGQDRLIHFSLSSDNPVGRLVPVGEKDILLLKIVIHIPKEIGEVVVQDIWIFDNCNSMMNPDIYPYIKFRDSIRIATYQGHYRVTFELPMKDKDTLFFFASPLLNNGDKFNLAFGGITAVYQKHTGQHLPIEDQGFISGNCFALANPTPLDKSLTNNSTPTLYPNPTQDFLQGFEKDGQLEVYDMTGKSFSLTVTNKVIDVRELSPGVYTIPHRGKFVKQ